MRDHAAPLFMNINLGSNDIGKNAATTGNSDGGLVAGGVDSEDKR